MVNYNLFREHEGIRGQRPAEMTGVNPPFTEWADIVRDAPKLWQGGKANLVVSTLADAADKADRRGQSAAGPNVHFVPDPTLRRCPKGETESDGLDDYPLSPPNPLRPRNSRVKTGWRLPQ